MNIFFLYLATLVAAVQFSPFDSPDFCSQIITPTCNTTFSYIDAINAQIRSLVVDLIHKPFFRFFKLDLDKQCKFWNAEHFCVTRNCAVEILPPEQYNWLDVPEDLSPSKLGEILRASSAHDEADTCEDLDYCHIDDDHNCVFVDLKENPERFTGYGGAQSFDVWKAIYSENCFPNTNPMSMTPEAEPELCVEKNLFYRIISGMHASIAVHLSNEYLDPETEEFHPNLKIFMERVGKFNDRLSNIYFNYAMVSQAIVKLMDIVSLPNYIKENHESVSGDESQLLSKEHVDPADYAKLLTDLNETLSSQVLFESGSLFDPAKSSPELKNEFRARFKNVSAIMDCVGCDRCRMWGKLQTIGYGTALKILFESEDPNTQHLLKFRRIELVALFNTFDRLSKSVEAINNFKSMYLQHLEDVAAGKAKHGDYEPLHDKGIEFPFVAFQPAAKKKEFSSFEELDEGVIESNTIRTQGFWEEVENIKDALWVVWDIYYRFPQRIWHYFVYYANGWWNVYVGRAVYVPQKKTNLKDEL